VFLSGLALHGVGIQSKTATNDLRFAAKKGFLWLMVTPLGLYKTDRA
jgi:hypothetical protein